MANTEIKVLSLNCWGVPLSAKDRQQRIPAIGDAIAAQSYDVVCLQEVWLEQDYRIICDKVIGVLPYAHYFYSGVIGSGVCIFSKYQIEEAFYHQWPVNGYIHKIHHGDWFGGKGVGLCVLKINNYKVNVYTAHLHAEYHRECDEYQAHRIMQAFALVQFINLTSTSADLVILAGDLNTEPGDLAYRLMLNATGFLDAFTECGDIPSDLIATNESLRNSYTPDKLIRKQIPGKRIDYIMYRPGPNINVALKWYRVPFPSKIPDLNISFSDHEAISASLAINRDETMFTSDNYDLKKNALEESISVCDDALKNLYHHKIIYGSFAIALFIVLILSLCTKSSFGNPIIYYLVKLVISLLLLFTILMATVWNQIERHGILNGKLGMEVILNNLKVKQ